MNFNYDAVKDLFRCPKTRAELVYVGDALVSCDAATRLRYPVLDGLPVLLADEALELSAADWSAAMADNGRDPATGDPAPSDSTDSDSNRTHR